jgi:hypothetical protein
MSKLAPSSQPRLFTFVGADLGPWAVRSTLTLMGEAWPPAPCLLVMEGTAGPPPPGAAWALAGITSNERYVERHEKWRWWTHKPAWGAPRQRARR